MSQHLYDNMVKLLPIHLSTKYVDVLHELHDEITMEFEENMRKSRGNGGIAHWLVRMSVSGRPTFPALCLGYG